MTTRSLLPSALIGAFASARSMTPMAALATARLAGRRTPGQLVLLEHPLVRFGALAMGVGEFFGDKMKTAPDRTVWLGLLARVMSAGIGGATLAPRGRERGGAAVAVAVPLAYLTLAGRKNARQRIGQILSGLMKWCARTVSDRIPRLNRPEFCLPIRDLRCRATFRGHGGGPTGSFGASRSVQRVSLQRR